MPIKRLQQRKTSASNQTFAPVDDELIEILDSAARPFMIMPRDTALSQNLPHQVVLVMLRDREGNVYIHRRSDQKKNYAGLWSVSASGLVQAGEALEDAAFRELNEELGISGIQLTYAGTAEPSADTDWGRVSLFVSALSHVIVNLSPEEISEGMFVDEDELFALLKDMPEMLTPALKWAAASCDLFRL